MKARTCQKTLSALRKRLATLAAQLSSTLFAFLSTGTAIAALGLLIVVLGCAGQPQDSLRDQPTVDTATPAPTHTPAATVPPTTPTAAVNPQVGRDGCVHLTPAQLAAMLQDKDFLLINTHAPYGIEIAHTDAHIPLDKENKWLSRYPTDKATKIVLYCRSGRWSTVAAKILVEAGYTAIGHLDGGMVAWQAARLPLQRQ